MIQEHHYQTSWLVDAVEMEDFIYFDPTNDASYLDSINWIARMESKKEDEDVDWQQLAGAG